MNIHYLVAKDSVDEAMWRVLQQKVRTLAQTLDGTNGCLAANQQSWQSAVQLAEGQCSAETSATGASTTSAADSARFAAEAGEDGADETLSLLAVRAQRERDTKLEYKRSAFQHLFRPKAPGVHTHSSPLSQKSAVSGGGSDDVIDLTEPEGGGGEAGGAATLAWFAVSSLTGRIHAFGDGNEPIPESMGASAPPLAIVDETEPLVKELAVPSMLAAGRRWVIEWQVRAHRVHMHATNNAMLHLALNIPPPCSGCNALNPFCDRCPLSSQAHHCAASPASVRTTPTALTSLGRPSPPRKGQRCTTDRCGCHSH